MNEYEDIWEQGAIMAQRSDWEREQVQRERESAFIERRERNEDARIGIDGEENE